MSAAPTTKPKRLQAVLQLFRLPNVFTAASNVLMGFLFTPVEPLQITILLLLIGASCCLYLAGMVLNDVFDVEVDREERPERPLPSGRISLGTARFLGMELMLVGVALGWTTSFLLHQWQTGIVATCLAFSVLLYDAWAKQTWLGPLVMGSCRALNVMLGMSAAVASWQQSHVLVAAGFGTYIVGVTWFARTEATQSRRVPLAASFAIMLAGLLLVAIFPLASGAPRLQIDGLESWWILWGLLMSANLWRAARAIYTPSPWHVQQAVRRCILSLILYDAAIVLATQGGAWAALVLVLLAPTLWLGRWIYST